MKRSGIMRLAALGLALLMLAVGCGETPADDKGGTSSSTTTTTLAEVGTSGTSSSSTTLLTGGTTGSTTTKAATTTKKTTTTTTKKVKVPSGAINVVKQGVDNTGKTDVTDKLIQLHKTGKPIYYPNGTYLFNGATLDFSGGVYFETRKGVVIRNAISATPIVNFDAKGNLIGLMHNHLELRYDDEDFVVNGNLVSPPLSTAKNNGDIDLIPYWYNDFGLQSQLVDSGWDGWHDWQWNHHDCTTVAGITDPYDPDRHPLLGWYRGDEVKVLDWQCYWLREYGMDQSILLAGYWGDTWSDPKNGQYWAYNLLNNTPNAKKMKFALSEMHSWGFPISYSTMDANWARMMTEFYGNAKYKQMVYCYEVDGERYPVIFVWDEKYLQQQVGGTAKLKELYVRQAERMKDAGFDGVCVLGRMSAVESAVSDLNQKDVKWFSAAYPANAIKESGTYEQMVNSFDRLSVSVNTVYGVALGMHTHDPHPSQWNHPGNTPALFKKWLQKAVDGVNANIKRPSMITCYNVSEWHEGCAGLVPTVGQGFGYLEAIRDVMT